MKPKVGDRTQVLEDQYCGIDFAKVGDLATVTSMGALASGFWVEFDSRPGVPCLILVEHAGVGWRIVEETYDQIAS